MHRSGESPSGAPPAHSMWKRALVATRLISGPGVTEVTSMPGKRVPRAALSQAGSNTSSRVSGTGGPPRSVGVRSMSHVPDDGDGGGATFVHAGHLRFG